VLSARCSENQDPVPSNQNPEPSFKIFGSNNKISIFVTRRFISLHLKTIENKILSKKPYNKPEVSKIILDNSISLVMMTVTPIDPPPRGDASKGSEPFASPFGDKPFG